MHTDFLKIKENNLGEFTDYKVHEEASEYFGCEYIYNDHKYIQRTAKITPKKVGQFVTLWKRNSKGLTVPFEADDFLKSVLILTKQDQRVGSFLFPKELLIEKGILTSSKDGKRGFRVYPDWDRPTSKQALKTQEWQLKCFSSDLRLNSWCDHVISTV